MTETASCFLVVVNKSGGLAAVVRSSAKAITITKRTHMIEMHYHARTKDEPWRCACPAHDLRSDNPKGPAFDLCRQLVDIGVEDGPATVCRDGRPVLLIRSIFDAAKATVSEGEDEGPRFAKWKPFLGLQDVVSRRDGLALMSESHGGCPGGPENFDDTDEAHGTGVLRRAA